MSRERGGTYVTKDGIDAGARGFLDALGRIQQISGAEAEGWDIPDDFIPYTKRLTYSNVAVKNAVVTTTATFLISPFTLLVIEKYLPLFGSRNPDLLDKFFAIFLSAAPSLCLALFWAYVISNIYVKGRLTSTLLNYHVTSYVITKFIITLIWLMVFWIIRHTVFSDENILSMSRTVYTTFAFFHKNFALSAYESTYIFLDHFKLILIKSAVYSTVIHTVSAVVMGLAYLRSYTVSTAIARLRDIWQ